MKHSSSTNMSARFISICLMTLTVLTFATPSAKAQATLKIGGKVYGGGKQGAVGTQNVANDVTLYTYYTQAEADAYNATLDGAISSSAALSVSVNDIDKINAVLGKEYHDGETVTDEDAKKYNATLPGAVTTATIKTIVDATGVKMADAAAEATEVTIVSGDITAVFGGGENGRSYGKTIVNINGGTIGIDGNLDAANGNVFGAGDGSEAVAFGGSKLTVSNGTIKGNAYGGGNEANLIGTTSVDLKGGTFNGSVYGGAKIADIFGHTFVNIDGENAVAPLHIVNVYGGNDISGTVSPTSEANWTWAQQANLTLPFALANTTNLTVKPASHVNNSWNAFILATKSASHKILIDNLYSGGNGDYNYADGPYAGKTKPVIDKTYMQITGGVYGSLYGGGNAATVNESTDICLMNDEDLTGYDAAIAALPETSKSSYSTEYQFNRVFGGNNKEPMAIRPNWYLEEASVNNLYSGGNAGAMTYFSQTSTTGSMAGNAGILIHVKSPNMTVNNVYGGCRMADVNPGLGIAGLGNGADMTINAETIGGYNFPQNYSARVLIEGGNINNVYGGNDVSGIVYYGSNVVIKSDIKGDVYGAGNGSYAYTDNTSWVAAHPEDADFYYDGGTGGMASAEALNVHRPNAAKSLVQLFGTDAEHMTHIGGAVYCGGNSATLRATGNDAQALAKATSQLIIGSYVIADNVFMGSNGVNMIDPAMLAKYADNNFSSLDLTQTAQFEEYMKGVEVAIRPTVSFEKNGELGATRDYAPYSTKFGSFYCGGNVGSMSADGKFTIDFLNSLVIYDKLVGGCNAANVPVSTYNAYHMGGLIGANDAGVKVELNLSGLKLEPRKLNKETFTLDWNTAPIAGVTPAKNMLQGGNIYGGCYASGYINGGVHIVVNENTISENVFTGATPADPNPATGVSYNDVRDDVLASTLAVYGGGYGKETEIWGNTVIDITGNGQIMKAYGGGEMGVVGKLQRNATTGVYATTTVEEWYPAKTSMTVCTQTFDVSDFQSRPHTVAQFTNDGVFNATVNLNATLPAGTTNNVAKLYAGGFQGTVSGNTIANLNRGRAYDAFGGASNADILGHAETYIGKASSPTITHNVYGANDFGGLIVGDGTFRVDNNKDGDNDDTMEKILTQTYVEYASGKIGDGSKDSYGDPINGNVFGGPCGAYDYADTRYDGAQYYSYAEYKELPGNGAVTEGAFNALAKDAKKRDGFCKPMLLRDLMTSEMLIPDPEGTREHVGYAANSFVNVTSQSTLASDEVTGSIFGAGQGMKGHINSADERGSYVRLMAATTSQRTVGPLSPRVYGAGYCSNTGRSLVDAHTGYFGTIFGAAHGISYEELTEMQLHSPAGTYETNYMGWRSAVRLYEMSNRNMDIYGGGANAGAQEAGVVLYGGQAHDVYGAQFDQGITYASSVDVPAGSTSRVNAIFGGARGKNDTYPCDAYNTFVTWRSADARLNDAIYGGNNNARMTRNAYIGVNQPVKNFEDKLTNVFGGGYGENTVTLYTEVGLHDGAQVANAYGGGNNGKVLDTPSFRYYLDDGELACSNTDSYIKPNADGLKTYPSELSKTNMTAAGKTPIYGYQKYLLDTEVIGFHEWIMRYNWTDCRTDGRGQPLGSYEANDHGHPHDLYFLSTQMDNVKNTHVIVEQGALVTENVYGGGYGELATVSGETNVQLLGGTVKGDIYGGGYGGHVEEYPHLIYPAGGEHELTMSATNVELGGGIARNVYGGGLNGNVTGATNVILGSKDMGQNDFIGAWYDGTNGKEEIARVPGKDYNGTAIFRGDYLYAGDPIVERSLYGGGQNGHVEGTAYLTLNQGHIGYKYDASHEVDGKSTAACYVENLDLNNPGDNFLDQNGNAFGAGYGEGAFVDVTYVNIYGGTIRNSLYGGGEIAAVGEATMTETGAHPVVGTITRPGRTHVYMYNGLVRGDVFGGGRGYSYDDTGNEVIGKVVYTDGYVFGTTEVEIRGGVVGTLETVEEGHGNVFGGGNIGYCFTDATKHGVKGDGDGEGRYYTNAWKCDGCGHIEYQHTAPTVCGHCHKSTTATDATFQITFSQVDINGNPTSANEKILSEDCRVVITPYAQVTAVGGIDIKGNGKTLPDGSVLKDSTFDKGDYVPTEYLNLLKDKNTDAAQWAKLSDAGVTIRNAVFAGGNVSSGSDKVYANAYTVFGNATASINDIFFRDMISVGTEHTGGLYGDGNLTFVDGYRELNITNYGTDYYSQQDHVTLDQYNAMNDRERAYFELEYEAKENHTYSYYSCNNAGEYGGTAYVRGQHITPATYSSLSESDRSHFTSGSRTFDKSNANDRIKQNEYSLMTDEEKEKWNMFGFCSIYAGRLLNSIQRADFCGVFGSRIVLEGAQDRVPEVVDYTQYTINRVGELSLNKKVYEGSDTGGLSAEAINHGNYFGMYNIVNYLGALTSDVKFDDVRTTDNTNTGYKDDVNGKPYGTATFYDWKVGHKGDRKRNNGTCHNTVALAAGVYLEIVKEPTTSVSAEDRLDPLKKNWGYITGIVQLDLINVMPGLGGGYVYAKNEHGERSNATSATGLHDNLSVYNKNAVNNTAYNYSNTKELVETSGNFIHNVKQIVDDCFPRGGDLNQPAHYWYIRGEFYVYDQYISAFTGSSTAYSENINLPLTITAGANGRLDLIDVKKNFYAYYKEGTTPLGANEAIVVNGVTYGLNDIITYWDYMQLSDAQKAHFVEETYVATMNYSTTGQFDNGGKGEPVGVITKGEVILPTDPRLTDGTTYKYYDPEEYTTDTETGVKTMKQIAATDVFHVSNAVSHENGYVLSVKLDNPVAWDSWYSPQSGANKVDQKTYSGLDVSGKSERLVGPTYYTETAGVYGQHDHVLDEVVTKTVVDAYNNIPPGDLTALVTAGKLQATVENAYVAVTAAEYDYDHDNNPSTAAIHKNVQAGVGISAAEYATLSDENKAKFSPAYTCTSTFEEDASSGLYVYFGELIPATRYQELKNALDAKYTADGIDNHSAAAEQTMKDHFDNAYIVTKAGLYGGQHFEAGKNYRALDTWATLSAEDRDKFHFRYDALDALVESGYPATGQEGPGNNNVQLYDGPYWDGQNSWPQQPVYGAKQAIDYTAKYELNDPLTWTDKAGTYHTLTKTDQALDREDYENLPNEKRHYSSFEVKAEDVSKPVYIVKSSFISGGTNYAAGKVITEDMYNSFDAERQNKIEVYTPQSAGFYYICREPYTVNEKGEGQPVTDIRTGQTYAANADVPAGIIINSNNYSNLVNKQISGFTIIGNSPIETTTFYVNRESNVFDLTKDRVVTLVYQYKYDESDESGQNVEEITERHVVNIHITFKSGVPTIGKLQDPSIILPGQTVGLKLPNVTPGAYEILGGGWELFTNAEDAEKHTNGKTYVNNATPMYWYQDGYYVAYYAKTYLGKTYSNSVPFKVANYHDIADVMADTEHYMYIDNPNVKRNSKIYIDNSYTDKNPDATKSEIDMLYDLFDKSVAKPGNEKTVYVDVQRTNSSGEPLYYNVDTYGNKIESEPYTTTPTAYPVTDQQPQQVQTINDHTRNCANLDFFLNEDVATKKAEWEPIGTVAGEGECFMGTLHGMGHTISGLTKSLFENLCGYVYNLGVTGSFKESGVANHVSTGTVPDTGDPENDIPATQVHGHVNSSWIYTSADPDAVEAENTLPVVGVVNNLSGGVAGIHTLNCYFPKECGYNVSAYTETPNKIATPATLRQFNNGEVTYNLNGFYLNKRYSDACVTSVPDGTTTPTTGDNAIYKYWTQQSDGTINATPTTGYYLGGGSMHAYNGENLGYVERLFADGDFVYKYGTIPLVTNERYSISDSRYLPVWPDDYYFFGQQLTYGYDETPRPYQPLPNYVRKTISVDGSGKDNRLLTTEQNNIVYRIPAYFRSSEKKWAHFNPNAVFADKMKEGYTLSAADLARGLNEAVLDGREIHKGLTALDFSGFNDRTIMSNAGTSTQKFQVVPNNVAFTQTPRTGKSAPYEVLNDNAYFAPITDYTTLLDFETHGVTQNLLTYAPATSDSWCVGAANTLSVLRNYFDEPVYASNYSNDKYRKVTALSESTISQVHGHLVEKESTTDDRHYYYAAEDHFLVDKQDFNAPIEYEFIPANGQSTQYRMWYQRTPDNYADMTKGWEGVSLPFAAELVSTQDKGEITHFYQDHTKGHEYWLREFKGLIDNDDPEEITANMNYPSLGTNDKTVTNTFLWDYYYNADGKDVNQDDYRPDINNDGNNEQDMSRYYYGQNREFTQYPFSVPGKPYIAGFPSKTYYEFDLSGQFRPQYSGTTTPAKLDAQTISFVSNTGITVKVSDVELADANAGMITNNNYTFYGNYLNVDASSSVYATVAEYNAAMGKSLTEQEFEDLDPLKKQKKDSDGYSYYVLNDEGSSFDLTTEEMNIPAFRPYFASKEDQRLKSPRVRAIVFGMSNDTQLEGDDTNQGNPLTGHGSDSGINIYAKKGTICVDTNVDNDVKVRITSVSGVTIVETTMSGHDSQKFPVHPGIYIVNKKKVYVR